MEKLKNKLYNFMQGRYGADELGRFLSLFVVVLLLISSLLGRFRVVSMIFEISAVVILVYAFYRILSRNLYKRATENNRFLEIRMKFRKGQGGSARDRKNYVYFKCPACGKEMKAPRGKGKIRVTCHQCNTSFEKKV